jgi:hypothetical protein
MDKNHAQRQTNQLSASGLSGKSITDLKLFQLGSVIVFEFSYSGGSQFIKVKQGIVELGGTAEWDTGTKANL